MELLGLIGPPSGSINKYNNADNMLKMSLHISAKDDFSQIAETPTNLEFVWKKFFLYFCFNLNRNRIYTLHVHSLSMLVESGSLRYRLSTNRHVFHPSIFY